VNTQEYRKWREMVKALGKVRTAEIYNKKKMNQKHGDKDA
jgi:hypothetical protein